MDPWNAQDVVFDESSFSGVVRLFPLPNLVLYPHVIQPLHVFEERYREMVVDALAGDRLITMAVLEPGWEPDYDGRPPIAKYGCLGKIIAHHRLDDGQFNLLLLGVRRVQIVRELNPIRAFRQARVKVLQDCSADDPGLDSQQLHHALLEAFQHHLPEQCKSSVHLEGLPAQHISLGPLTDLVSYTLPMNTNLKRQLLGECCIELRAQILLQQLEAQLAVGQAGASAAGRFPPPFSAN